MKTKPIWSILPTLIASSIIISACNQNDSNQLTVTKPETGIANISTAPSAQINNNDTNLNPAATYSNPNLDNSILAPSIDPEPAIFDEQVNLELKNTAPTADAGANKSIISGNPVRLDASASFDADNEELAFSWSIINLPEGSNTELGAINTAKSNFTPDVPGAYTFEVAVSDETSTSSDQVTVTASEINTETKGILCDFNQDTFKRSTSVNAKSIVNWFCTDSKRMFYANGLPEHLNDEFPNGVNQNTISEQMVIGSFPIAPKLDRALNSLHIPNNITGYMLNGIVIDNHTSGSCRDFAISQDECNLADETGNWDIEVLALSSLIKSFGIDANNAHVNSNGKYHYHGISEELIKSLGSNSSRMTIIGWATDGFPIYSRFGYSNPNDTTSPLKRMTSSYQLISTIVDTRPSAVAFPLGTFTQDWMYIHASSDLDECNGRFGVTPEFPDGIYHYFAIDEYPFLPRCVKGLAEDNFTNGGTMPSLAPPPPPS